MTPETKGRPPAGKWIGIVLCILPLALTCCSKSDKPDPNKELEEAPINVRVERPRVQPMEEVIEVNGNLEPANQVEVVSEVSGAVLAIEVDENDRVRAGQVLARIDDEEYQLNYRQALTSLRVARADYESTSKLFEAGMKSKSEYEKMQRSFLDAQTNAQISNNRLKNTVIRSPIDGIVVARNIEPHKMVGTMETLFSVADLGSFLIKITVTEAEVAKIREGQEVRVRVDALATDANREDFPFAAKVSQIQPMVDPQSGTVQVEVSLENQDERLRAGMFARLRIVTAVHENALVVPRRALSTEDENQVWVVDGKGVKMVEVKTGLVDQTQIEILSGLTVGDLTVVEGQEALTPKSKINIVNAKAPSGAGAGATAAEAGGSDASGTGAGATVANPGGAPPPAPGAGTTTAVPVEAGGAVPAPGTGAGATSK